MRIIDADKFKQQIAGMAIVNGYSAQKVNKMCELIDAQPTAYDVDKVVEQLETARDGYSTAQLMTTADTELVKRFIAKEKAMNLAIEIVKAGGIDGN